MAPDHHEDSHNPDEGRALIDAIRHRILTLPEMAMRSMTVGQLLMEAPPEAATRALDFMVRGTLHGDEGSTKALIAFLHLLLRAEAGRLPEDAHTAYEAIRALYEAAAEAGRDHLTYLFLQLPPHQRLLDRRVLAQPRFDRDVSLGERKQMARGNNRVLIERLMIDLDPSVIQKLLANPRVAEQDVMRICTRRPNVPEALTEVALNGRWFVRERIRYALLSNPYSPTSLSLKCLPLMRRPDLARIAKAGDLHPAINQTARRLLELGASTA